MRRVAAWGTGALGILLIAAGGVVFAVADRRDRGWFAYAPLGSMPRRYADYGPAESGNGSWSVLWTGGHLVGAGLLVLGLLVLVALAGWLLGRRAGRRSVRAASDG